MRSIQRLSPSVLLSAVLLFVATSPATGDGASVTFPLEDYLQLVERIERIDEERRSPKEPAVAELTRQTTRVTIEDATGDSAIARIEARYRVELRGRQIQPVALPMSGLVTQAKIESSPTHGADRVAALHRKGEELLLVATETGSYEVSISARAKLEESGGISQLKLALSRAGVATLDVDLPAALDWDSIDAVTVEESTDGRRRRLRLAPVRGKRPVLELRRDATGTVEEQTRAQAVMLTVARLGPGGVERHDVVLYEVSRGELNRFAVGLPSGPSDSLVVDRAVTDEGPALPIIENTRLTVERRQRLSAIGHLALAYAPVKPDADGRVPLPAVAPAVSVRSHYLVLASDRAGKIEPLPAEAWRRVDLDDLPRVQRAEIAAIGPSSVWRRTEAPAEPWLRLEIYPELDALPTIVGRRATTTLLTVDGSLVHRDVFELRRAGASLDLTLPAEAVLWSTTVDGQAVRPLERGSEVAVPLAFKAADALSNGGTRVELVMVLKRRVPRGTSRLKLDLARIADPVLEHRWRLLLPEQHRYRFASGALRPAPPDEAAVIDVGSPSGSLPRFSVVDSASGDAGITGTVADEDGARLPGVMITAGASNGQVFSVVTDGDGEFALWNLVPGAYRVTAALDGFNSLAQEITVPAGRTLRAELVMSLSGVMEEIMVTARMPVIGPTSSVRAEFGDRKRQQAAREELEELQQGLVGGVKPLAVEIPESGKLLLLSGVLPPPEVSVELEVKTRR